MLTPVFAEVFTKGHPNFLARALASVDDTCLLSLRSHLLATITHGIPDPSSSRARLISSYSLGNSSKVSLAVIEKMKRKPSPERYHCCLKELSQDRADPLLANGARVIFRKSCSPILLLSGCVQNVHLDMLAVNTYLLSVM